MTDTKAKKRGKARSDKARSERGARSELTFGEIVREIRKGQALSQEDLGQRAELAPDAISRLENGFRNPRPSTVRKLASALGVGVEVLTGSEYVPMDSQTNEISNGSAQTNGKKD